MLNHAQVSIADEDLIEGCDGVVTIPVEAVRDMVLMNPTASPYARQRVKKPSGLSGRFLTWTRLQPSVFTTGRNTLSALLAQGSNDQLAGNTYVAGIGNLSGCLTITFTSGSLEQMSKEICVQHQLWTTLRGACAGVEPR